MAVWRTRSRGCAVHGATSSCRRTPPASRWSRPPCGNFDINPFFLGSYGYQFSRSALSSPLPFKRRVLCSLLGAHACPMLIDATRCCARSMSAGVGGRQPVGHPGGGAADPASRRRCHRADDIEDSRPAADQLIKGWFCDVFTYCNLDTEEGKPRRGFPGGVDFDKPILCS